MSICAYSTASDSYFFIWYFLCVNVFFSDIGYSVHIPCNMNDITNHQLFSVVFIVLVMYCSMKLWQ